MPMTEAELEAEPSGNLSAWAGTQCQRSTYRPKRGGGMMIVVDTRKQGPFPLHRYMPT